MYERYYGEPSDDRVEHVDEFPERTPLRAKYLRLRTLPCGESAEDCQVTRAAGRCPVAFPTARDHRTDAVHQMNTSPTGVPERCSYPASWGGISMSRLGINPTVPDVASPQECADAADSIEQVLDLWVGLNGGTRLHRQGIDISGDIRYFVWWLRAAQNAHGYTADLLDVDPF